MFPNYKPRSIVLAIDNYRSLEHFGWTVLDSMNEMEELAVTAGLEVVAKVSQQRVAPDSGTFFGKGKLEEIKELVLERSIECVLFDDELTPNQQRNIETILKVKVVDRTTLILDIFAQRAQTSEAKFQVELAQLEYLLPRLTRMWTHLSRLGGGIGTRGPGEKQLEVDKRQIRKKIEYIKGKLEKVVSHRDIVRKRREDLPLLNGAIVGYTNAGKSTLLNALTHAQVHAEDKLFATLDPTTRLFRNDVVLTDTVGFVKKLPHQLISAFKSTLEESVQSDFILHVVDISHPKWESMLVTSNELLASIGASDIPKLYIFNKIDLVPENFDFMLKNYQPYVLVSVLQNKHMDVLAQSLDAFLNSFYQQVDLLIPFNKMDIQHLVHQYGIVEEENFTEQGVSIKAKVNKVILSKIQPLLYS